MSMSISGNEIN